MSKTTTLPPLPKSWSDLTWQQLTDCWQVKMRYGGNADVARAAALLGLLGMECRGALDSVNGTGEPLYGLRGKDGSLWTVTARELSQMAKRSLPWFDYPYGDPGEPVVKDERGMVVKEARPPVRGYVGPMRDALALPVETIRVGRRTFALPQVACNNLSWQQYRSLQATAPQLFAEGASEETVLGLQAQFLAHCLVPRSLALLDTNGGSIRFRPHWEYTYDSVRAEGLVAWWRKKLAASSSRHNDITVSRQDTAVILFHICFQAYQTALSYYAQVFPLLFNGGGKSDPMQDALKGETQTLNAVMKYQGYTKPEDVYAENLPIILSTLNTMAEEAKQIEQMNARIKRK